MILLKNLLIEVQTRRYLRSWLSPDGEFYPTLDKEGNIINHENTAIGILDDLNIDSIGIENPINILYKKKWQRIVQGSQGQELPQVLQCNNPYYKPNNKQKLELIKLAIEYDIETIMYDDGTSRGFVRNILWNINDL